MQGKSKSLRLGLLALVVVLILGALGSLSLARDAFDSDFDDCRQSVRLAAVGSLAVERTDEEDEIRISWEALEQADLSDLGGNVLKARITVIVEGGGIDDAMNVALGEIDIVVDDVDFAKDLTVSVALTLGDYVISDIAEADFTSGMPAPSFKTDIVAKVAEGDVDPGDYLDPDGVDYGDFYYLGFNDLFDNWYTSAKGDPAITTRPRSPKFRVGLQHGDADVDAGDADFENYRITIEDSNGDLLGYQAETVSASAIYNDNDNVIVFGTATDFLEVGDIDAADADGEDDEFEKGEEISNIRLSNQVAAGRKDPYYEQTIAGFTVPTTPASGLAFGNIAVAVRGRVADGDATPAIDAVTSVPAAGVLYAVAPVEYFDFPNDVFEGDGNYTINAWAENDDGTRISPQTSVLLSVRENTRITGSDYQGYTGDPIARAWDGTPDGVNLAVWGLTIQDD
jgi:hypothetical protein